MDVMRLVFRSRLLLLMLVMALTVGCGMAKANDVYIAQTAAGRNTGADCSDALVYTYFNTSGNWTSGMPTGAQIGPGTAVHLCAGTYSFAGGNTNGLAFQGGGSSGGVITLIADQGPVTLTAPYWGNTSGPNVGPVNTNGHSYITIDGENQLTLQATANGTLLANQVDWGNGLVAKGGRNVTIENLTVSNIYVHSCRLPISNCTDEGGPDTGGISAYGSNLLVRGNTVHDAKLCIGGNYGGGITINNEAFQNNTLYNCDHGFEVGDGSANDTVINLIISDNDISNFQNWDDFGVNNHHDGIHQFSYNSGDSVVGYQAYNNYIHGDFGANMNAAIYQESSTETTGTLYFNNLIVDSASMSHLGCGEICVLNQNAGIYNNTIAATTGHGTVCVNVYYAGDVIKNNTCTSVGEAISVTSAANYANTAIDYNNYYNIGSNGWNQIGTFQTWQSLCSCDAHGNNNNPNLSAETYRPTSLSSALAGGISLTSLSITALAADKTGVPSLRGRFLVHRCLHTHIPAYRPVGYRAIVAE